MKPVTEYQNFRVFIRDFYTERKVRSGFTWREFAREAGYSSPVFLKLVCDGTANLSDAGMERVAEAMGLVGVDLQYFRTLVRFNQEKDAARKREIFKELRAITKENEITLVGEDQYDYYESWVNPVLREMAPYVSDSTPAQMADKLTFGAQAAEVKKALQLLQRVGLLNKTADGKYKGQVIWLAVPTMKDGTPKRDILNPDPKKRNTPGDQIVLLWGFTYDADKDMWVNGEIYDPCHGKTYKCRLNFESDTKLKVRGYIGAPAFGKSMYWYKID